MGPYAGVDYNINLCPLQIPEATPQHIYHVQPYARVGFIPQSGTLDLASEEYNVQFCTPQSGKYVQLGSLHSICNFSGKQNETGRKV